MPNLMWLPAPSPSCPGHTAGGLGSPSGLPLPRASPQLQSQRLNLTAALGFKCWNGYFPAGEVAEPLKPCFPHL